MFHSLQVFEKNSSLTTGAAGGLRGTLFGPGKLRIKWLEKKQFGTTFRGRRRPEKSAALQQPVDDLWAIGG